MGGVEAAGSKVTSVGGTMTVDSLNVSGTRRHVTVFCVVTTTGSIPATEYSMNSLSTHTDADTRGLLGTSLLILTLRAGR